MPKPNKKGLRPFALQYQLYGMTFPVEVHAINLQNAERKLKRLKAEKKREIDKAEARQKRTEELRSIAQTQFEAQGSQEAIAKLVEAKLNALVAKGARYLVGVYIPTLDKHELIHFAPQPGWGMNYEQASFEGAKRLADVLKQQVLWMQVIKMSAPDLVLTGEEVKGMTPEKLKGLINKQAPIYTVEATPVFPSVVERHQQAELDKWLKNLLTNFE